MSADIFFGDSQLPPGRVSIATVAGVKAHEALLRIRTDSAVNEPIVTVLLREGCVQSSTRKYVVLADIEAAGAAVVTTVDGEVVPSTPETAQPVVARDIGSKAGGQPGTLRAEPSGIIRLRDRAPGLGARAGPSAEAVNAQLAAAAEPRPARPSSRVAAAAPKLARKSARPRLKLDPLDLTSVRDPVLRSSTELLTMPSTVAQQRVAAAALWQALNAQPQEVLRNNLRLKSLETDVEKILAQSGKTERSVAELRAKLEQARGEKYSNWLVFALGALLMLSMLTAGFLWARGRRQDREFAYSPWWYKVRDAENKLDLQVSARLDRESMAQPSATRHSSEEGKAIKSSLETDLDLPEPHFTNLKNVRTPESAASVNPLEPREHSGFTLSFPSLAGMPRIMNAEELPGVPHQVDFFMSLGQLDKAVDVLRNHISDNVGTSTRAYLDLFDLYHRLGRKDDYELLRKDFNLAFNAEVTEFDEYTTDSQGLEFYASALLRLESLWRTPRILNVIEETIFRKPDSNDGAFSLAAYSELLMLYAIARETSEQPSRQADLGISGSSATSVNGFFATRPLPLSAELCDKPVPSPLPEMNLNLTCPPASCLGLDIDLSRDAED